MKVYKPKNVIDAVNCLQTFLEVDLYTKFRPEIKLGKEKWFRQDVFKNQKEFFQYLQDHFDILRKEIRSLQRRKK